MKHHILTGAIRGFSTAAWEGLSPAQKAQWQDYAPAPPQPSDAEIYAEHLAAGYLDPVTGLKLKTTESAQTKFTSQVTLLQVALGAGAVNASTPVEFWDYADAPQALPLSDFMGLILRYGLHCSKLFKDYAP